MKKNFYEKFHRKDIISRKSFILFDLRNIFIAYDLLLIKKFRMKNVYSNKELHELHSS